MVGVVGVALQPTCYHAGEVNLRSENQGLLAKYCIQELLIVLALE